jgi:glutamate--cysteine ligase regulatory subunit
MTGGTSAFHRPVHQKSNIEFLNSLQGNIAAAREGALEEIQLVQTPPAETADEPLTNGESASGPPQVQDVPYTSWTGTTEGTDTLEIPRIDWTDAGLSEDRAQYDVTAKLFILPLLPESRRATVAAEAVELVLKALNIRDLDLLVTSFPDIYFDAEDEGSDSEGEAAAAGSGLNQPFGQSKETAQIAHVWTGVEKLENTGIVKELGVSEFGLKRLESFLQWAHVKPRVDQVNLRDCCVVPKPLIRYAKGHGIKLLTHNDCTDILPPGTVRELLGPREDGGVGVLTRQNEDSTKSQSGGLQGDVEPWFVVKYTAVIKDRGIIENKGYFAVAELRQ